MARRPTGHPTAPIPMAVRLAGPIHRRILISHPGTAIRFIPGCSPGTEGSSLTDFLEVRLSTFFFSFLLFSFLFLFFAPLKEGREGGGEEEEEGGEGREGGRAGVDQAGHCFVFLGTVDSGSLIIRIRIIGIVVTGLFFDLS